MLWYSVGLEIAVWLVGVWFCSCFGAAQDCCCGEKSELSYFCRICGEYKGWRPGKNNKNFDSSLYNTPRKCVLSHLPCTTPVCHNVSCHTSLAQHQFVTLRPVTPPLHNTSLSQCVTSQLPCTTPFCHNVSCHISLAQRQFVTMCPVTPPLRNTILSQFVLSHLPCTTSVCHNKPHLIHTDPPYLPELNPCDLCVFSRNKNGLNFRRFSR